MNATPRSPARSHRRLFHRGERIYVKIKLAGGAWKDYTTGLSRGEEADAEILRQHMQREVDRGVVLGLQPGQRTVTFGQFYAWWIERRKARGLAAWTDDRSRIETHVLDLLKDRPMKEITPLDLELVFQRMRERDRAPKTVWNAYSSVRALFRDAHKHGYIDASPCLLGEEELGAMVDKDPEWRPQAIYERDEALRLMFDECVPIDRRVFYAITYLAGRRLGETSGLRFRHVKIDLRPLGSMTFARSYARGRTKTKETVVMPIHPALAILLRWWMARGFEQMFGRAPEPDDFIVPRPPAARSKFGPSRDKNYVRKQLVKDLVALGLRHRRTHDFRRAFITHVQEDGADSAVLIRLTHPSTKKATAFAGYTDVSFDRACAEVRKLHVEVPALAEAALLVAVGDDDGSDRDPDPGGASGVVRLPSLQPAVASRSRSPLRLAAGFAAVEKKAQEFPGLRQWRRRESKLTWADHPTGRDRGATDPSR